MIQFHFIRIFGGFSLAILIFCLAACRNDEPLFLPGTYDEGVFIVHEGPFQSGTGTIYFYNSSLQELYPDIFQAENGFPLGNIVQSMSVHEEIAYIVVNNAGKIEVVDAPEFKHQGTISGLSQPRYFQGVDAGKGYVSQWGATGQDGSIAIVDLNSLMVTGNIPTGGGPERMLKSGNRIYVVNSGGFALDSTVVIIDSATDQISGEIEVGHKPNSIQLDANGLVWVLCGGNKVYNPDFTLNQAASSSGSLHRIDPASNQVDLSLELSDKSLLPDDLVISPDRMTLYYNAGGVFDVNVVFPALPSNSLISRSFYGLGINPVNGDIYGADPLDFNSNGKFLINNKTGAPLVEREAGVIPSDFLFRD